MSDNPQNKAQNDAERSRFVTWQDPMIGAQAARTMSGLDYPARADQSGTPRTTDCTAGRL